MTAGTEQIVPVLLERKARHSEEASVHLEGRLGSQTPQHGVALFSSFSYFCIHKIAAGVDAPAMDAWTFTAPVATSAGN